MAHFLTWNQFGSKRIPTSSTWKLLDFMAIAEHLNFRTRIMIIIFASNSLCHMILTVIPRLMTFILSFGIKKKIVAKRPLACNFYKILCIHVLMN